MARKGIQPAELTLQFYLQGTSGTKYIDIAQCLSAINRRLYAQGKCYYINKVSVFSAEASITSLKTLPDTWVTSNAWVKAKALWNNMNKGVLKDNPSIKGKWADFKVMFDAAHYAGGISSDGPTLNILPFTGEAADDTRVKAGEWYMGRYVSPQHDVDPTSGEELAADEYYCHMLGDDSGSSGSYASVGIVKGYETTRARVQIAPDVPANMQSNWMTELSDLGGQDPELANVLEDANDNPPYDLDEYPGGVSNYNLGQVQSYLATTSSIYTDEGSGFKVPLGLIKLTYANAHATKGQIVMLHLTPGYYKGVMATEVKQ